MNWGALIDFFVKLTVNPPFKFCPFVVVLAGYAVFAAAIPEFFDGECLLFVLL